MHPLWRGFWLGLILTAALVLLGGTDWLSPYRFDRRAIALGGAVTLGAFLAALPGRLRRGRSTLLAFGGGLLLTLGAGMAGGGRILPALAEGSTGAYAFVAAAWLTGFITARIRGRRARA